MICTSFPMKLNTTVLPARQSLELHAMFLFTYACIRRFNTSWMQEIAGVHCLWGNYFIHRNFSSKLFRNLQPFETFPFPSLQSVPWNCVGEALIHRNLIRSTFRRYFILNRHHRFYFWALLFSQVQCLCLLVNGTTFLTDFSVGIKSSKWQVSTQSWNIILIGLVWSFSLSTISSKNCWQMMIWRI